LRERRVEIWRRDRQYIKEDLPKLEPSIQGTNKNMVNKHIKPKWEKYPILDVTPQKVDEWLTSLTSPTFGAASKVRARDLMKTLFDLAMLEQMIPFERNPMELVKVKSGSKRQKRIVIITPEQLKLIVKALPEPYNLMVLVCGCLGLPVGEVMALKCEDIDYEARTVSIKRVYTHSQIQDSPKTSSSEGELPLCPALVLALKEWQSRKRQEHDFPFVFASPRTGSRSPCFR
jgi:integrase